VGDIAGEREAEVIEKGGKKGRKKEKPNWGRWVENQQLTLKND
jgi:hypothetical protein